MYKICTIVGTRPELIKLSRIIPELDKYFKHYLIHSGQNYDYSLNKVFFNDLKIRKPNYFLNVKDKLLSKQITSSFFSNSLSTKCDPRKPAPPVIKLRILFWGLENYLLSHLINL